MSAWDPSLYLKFAGERTRPAMDLVARVEVTDPRRIVDLGCGPGNSTAILRQRWPEAVITGLDNSAEMIEAAKASYPEGEWLLGDLVRWSEEEGQFSIVFSNAALQWLPDHHRLIPRLMARLAPEGVLAVQIPAHYRSPLHRVVEEVADAEPWSRLMDGARNALTRESPQSYYNILQPLSSVLDIWESEYFHVLDSHQAIVDWFRGTGLRPYLDSLESDAEKRDFEKRVLHGYKKAYPQQEDGRVLLPFRRLFIVARR